MIICTSCQEEKPKKLFYYRVGRRCYQRQCKDCSHKIGPESKFSSSWWSGKFSEEEIKLFTKLKNLCTKARLRSKEFGPDVNWEYLLTLWAQQDGQCIYSGLPLSIKANQPHIVSLDRRDSSKGYVVGNLQLVSWSVNKMKQDLTEELFLLLCNKITSNQI